MGQQGRELLSHGVAAIIFVADDTVESLISFTGFHYQEGSYGIEVANPLAYGTDYLGK
jgi:hypothetical protein